MNSPEDCGLTAERSIQTSLGGARQELARSCGSVSSCASSVETTEIEMMLLEVGAAEFAIGCSESVRHATQVASLWPWWRAVPLCSVCAIALDSSRASVSDAQKITSCPASASIAANRARHAGRRCAALADFISTKVPWRGQ